MKKIFSALVLCTSLLVALSFWLFPVAKAQENPLLALLNLPAPPPPNPFVRPMADRREDFFNKSNPPGDDAPIEDLLEYWGLQSQVFNELGYNPKPSDRSIERILDTIEKDSSKIENFLNILQNSSKAAAMVKKIYDSRGAAAEREGLTELKKWLTLNTPHFSSELQRTAQRAGEVGEYVSHQNELLALTRVDWDKAKPIVDRLYSGNGPTSKVLGMWANYRRALDSDSIGDIDKYRDELKAVVVDKNATDGMRDLAFDALVKEKHWSGLEDWYYTLLADETLDDLRVDGRSYTGLTTIIYYTPEEKFTDKMIALVLSDNITVRTAAVKNLLLRLSGSVDGYQNAGKINPDIVRALLPWLENPKWVKIEPAGRRALINALKKIKLPESVPALIATLDEKVTVPSQRYSANTNASRLYSNAGVNTALEEADIVANTAVNAANALTNRAVAVRPETAYPLRTEAIEALATQADMRAGSPLRRILPEIQEYERAMTVRAILTCSGFTVEEQVEALEMLAKTAGDLGVPNSNANTYTRASTAASETFARAQLALQSALSGAGTQVAEEAEEPEDDEEVEYPAYDGPIGSGSSFGSNSRFEDQNERSKPFDATELNLLLGSQLVTVEDVGEPLVQAMVERITIHDKKDPPLASTLRKVMLGWKGTALNALLLRDLKGGRLDADAIVKLLSIRRELREKQQADVYDVRTGRAAAVGISTCLLEDTADYDAILNGGNDETKTAMLACARLIRAALPVAKVVENLQSKDRMLAIAAERYLESEDSPEARAVVLSLYPNQAKILGATTAFEVKGLSSSPGIYLGDLFGTVSDYYASGENANSTFSYSSDFSTLKTRLQKEVVKDQELLGVYSYENNFVRIYKDRAMLSWEDDPARYRERALSKAESDDLKGYLAHHKVDRLPPFLSCTEDCVAKQLLMLGRQGGRRVFVKASTTPEFFAELEAMFAKMKTQPAKLKYWAGNQLPGLEILFADENRDAITVWKSGGDFRILLADKIRQKEIEKEILSASETPETPDDEDPTKVELVADKIWKIRQARRFDSYSWFNLSGENLDAPAAQPVQVEYVPVKDSFTPASSVGQWKAKTASMEIRADEQGLYTVKAGKITLIREGNYGNPVVTPNGRWVIASKIDDDYNRSLVRVNLLTNKEFKVVSDKFPATIAVVYIASLNRIMVSGFYDGHEREYEEDASAGYYLLDPETGAVQPTAGEVRPLAQQSFRALQQAGSPAEFWAAMPRGKKETVVGIYNTKNFTISPIVRLPKVVFDSMNMWVDQTEGKVYFVYEGHVLSAPLNVKAPPK